MNTCRKSLATEVADAVRLLVAKGRIAPGAYLPTERELVAKHKVSRVTVRRALRQLVTEGLIQSVPYRGYRPAPARAGGAALGPVAYVLAQAAKDAPWDRTHEQIFMALNRVLMTRGRHALAVGCKGRGPEQTMREIADAGCSALVLDTSLDEFVAAAADSGLPCVIVDAYCELPGLDIVIQDNFNGARQAAALLAGRGHRRIGWIGPARGTAHSRERFAGARAGLGDAGLDFHGPLLADLPQDSAEQAASLVSRALAQPDRPTALVCMWLEMALGAARAVRQAGLVVGRDLELAAWATEQEYREVLAPEFLGGEIPVTMVWRPDDMAELALARLEERARHPRGPAARVDVRVRLVERQPAEAVLRGHGR
jgi:DNA-binding LacI/PurR family transcriptional regulator